MLLQVQAIGQECLRLLEMRLWAPIFAVLPRGQASPLLQEAQSAMQLAGFVQTHSRRQRHLCFSRADLPQWVDVYYHRERDVHAFVYIASCPQLGQAYEVELQNTYVDGSSLMTFWRGSARFRLLPKNCIAVAARQPQIHHLMQAHLRRRQHVPSVRTHAADALLLARTWSERALLWLTHEGKTQATDARWKTRDLYRLSLSSALQMAVQHWWRRWLRRAYVLQSGFVLNPSQAALDELRQAQQEIWQQAWAVARSAQRPAWLRHLPQALLAGGFLLLSYFLAALHGVLAASAVLLFHQALQWMMRYWRAHLHALQDAPHPLLILLTHLTPLALGMAFAAGGLSAMLLGRLSADKDSLFWWLPCFLLIFYGVQLLPLRPLLGAKIADVLLPWAWLRLLFILILALALLLMGIVGARWLCLAAAILLLLQLPSLWRQVHANALLRKAVWPHTASQLAKLQAMQPVWDSLAKLSLATQAGRLRIVQVLARRKPRRPIGITASLFGLSLYASCGLLVPGVLLSFLLAYPKQTVVFLQHAYSPLHINKGDLPHNTNEIATRKHQDSKRFSKAKLATSAKP